MPFLLEGLLASLRISPKRIPSIDDNVAWLQKRHKLLDHRVHRRSRLDHDLRLARPREGLHKFSKSLGGHDTLALGAPRGELFSHCGGSIEHADSKASAFHVQNKILAHDGEAD